ncbi:helix-turn-helix domain-containing protein [Aquimarina litoralis]|uniref:helix-turn-helix domain-containing protein n=1 Tax=Aquimarina litoralis TaxID=584605 RepID=UPI001C58598E|nr:AraC family transcriptional regulator [Aquimarina litoralis]MBW1298422.1 helix-turn-helix domain-containing protein [Aquimarina litoralis]
MFTGTICSILLFTNHKKKKSNTYLGLAILAFVWLNTKTLLLSLNLWEIHGFGFFPNGIELAIPPLFYFYLKSLVQPSFTFGRKQWLHFIPFFLSQCYATFVYIAIMQTSIYSEKYIIANSFLFNEVKHIEEYLMIISTIIYLYFGFQHIQKYRNWLSKNIADTKYSELNFLNILLFGVSFISIYILTNLMLNSILPYEYNWRWRLGHVLIAVLIYYLGLVGYKNSDLVPLEFSIKPKPKQPKNLTDEIQSSIMSKFKIAIDEDKVHLNPKLSLQELAKLIGVSETNLSNSINTYYGENFRTVINKKRIEEVKKRLLNDDLNNLSFLGLAKECGFNSEASFYRIFKTTVGFTPKQYLEKHLNIPKTQ